MHELLFHYNILNLKISFIFAFKLFINEQMYYLLVTCLFSIITPLIKSLTELQIQSGSVSLYSSQHTVQTNIDNAQDFYNPFNSPYTTSPTCVLGFNKYLTRDLSGTSLWIYYFDMSNTTHQITRVLHKPDLYTFIGQFICMTDHYDNLYTGRIHTSSWDGDQPQQMSGNRSYTKTSSFNSSNFVASAATQDDLQNKNVIYYSMTSLLIHDMVQSEGFDYEMQLILHNATTLRFTYWTTKLLRFYYIGVQFLLVNLDRFTSGGTTELMAVGELVFTDVLNVYNYEPLDGVEYVFGIAHFIKDDFKGIEFFPEKNTTSNTMDFQINDGVQVIIVKYLIIACNASQRVRTFKSRFCQTLDSDFSCTLCQTGYNLTSENDCIPAIDNCLRLYLSDHEKCDFCRSGYVLMLEDSFCVEELPNCVKISDGNFSQCEQCADGYEINEENLQCEQIFWTTSNVVGVSVGVSVAVLVVVIYSCILRDKIKQKCKECCDCFKENQQINHPEGSQQQIQYQQQHEHNHSNVAIAPSDVLVVAPADPDVQMIKE